MDFVPCLDFEMIKKLQNFSLVIDDSCGELYQEKEFVNTSTVGRHKKVQCIFMKHNLFTESKWSRTFDLSTSLIVLSKSPRDIQQINVFRRQLNKTKFLGNSYKKATPEPIGHLLIDFDARTSGSLRFCSNVVGTAPPIFLPSSLAKETPLTNERE